MATAKKTAAVKKPATTKPTTITALANYDEELAKYAEASVAKTGPAGSSINSVAFSAAGITVDETLIPSMEAVVVNHIFSNNWRPDKYDANNPMPPRCFALGEVKDEMVPHENSFQRQGFPERDYVPNAAEESERSCANCWAMQWESAEQGRGKACKEQRKLAMIPGDEESLQEIEDAKLYVALTPVTSSGSPGKKDPSGPGLPWDAHVKKVATTLHKPPFGIVTKIATTPDPVTQFRVWFDVADTIKDSCQIAQLIDRHRAALPLLMEPYPKATEEQFTPKVPARNNKFAGKAAAKKTAARR